MTDVVNMYLHLPIKSLNGLGLWIPPKKFKTAYVVYGATTMAIEYSFFAFQMVYILQVWGDFDATSEASYLFFTQACLCYKMTTVVCKRDLLKLLCELMQADIFQPKTISQEKMLKRHAAKVRRVAQFFLVMAVLTIFLWAILPPFDVSADTLPFKIWMPVSTEESPLYETSYAYQVLGVLMSAFIFNAVDSLALAMLAYCCAQLTILQDKVSQIKPTKMKKQIKNDQRTIRSENYLMLCDCVRHHQAIVKFFEQVQNAFHMNIFYQMLCSIGMICIGGLQITTTRPGSIQFASMLSFLVGMMIQLHTFCWLGQEITARSYHLRDMLYLCPWYTEDFSFNKSLRISMERMKRPMVFRAGVIGVPLSLPTFMSILRSSYSYFAVLQRVRNKPH